jgi:hypothetical protein
MSRTPPQVVTLDWLKSLKCDIPVEDLPERERLITAGRIAERFDGLQWWLRSEILGYARDSPEISSLTHGRWAERWDKPLPDLPRIPGSCWIVMTTEAQLPVLRDALLLPLQWVPVWGAVADQDHSTLLPTKLRSLAQRVVAAVEDPRSQERKWSLKLLLEEPRYRSGTDPRDVARRSQVADEDDPDTIVDRLMRDIAQKFQFHEFEAEWESGWASLTNGLLAAMYGARLDTAVWASAAWKTGQVQEVGRLPQKLALAADWTARTFFVPHQNHDEAEQIRSDKISALGAELEVVNRQIQRAIKVDPNLERKRDELARLRANWQKMDAKPLPKTSDAVAWFVRALVGKGQITSQNQEDLKAVEREKPAELVLEPLSQASFGQPTSTALFDEHCSWFLRFARSDDSEKYYYDHIIETIAEGCRDALKRRSANELEPGGRLVTILSTSWVSLLGAMIVRPSECLVLFSDNDPQLAERKPMAEQGFRSRLAKLNPGGVRVEFRSFSREVRDLASTFQALVNEFAGTAPRAPLIFDVTSGTSRMKFHLASLATPSDRILVIDNRISPKNGRYFPGTEQPELLSELGRAL